MSTNKAKLASLCEKWSFGDEDTFDQIVCEAIQGGFGSWIGRWTLEIGGISFDFPYETIGHVDQLGVIEYIKSCL